MESKLASLPIKLRVLGSVQLLSPGGLDIGDPEISAARPALQISFHWVHPDKGTLLGTKKGGTTDTHNSTVNFKRIVLKEKSQTQKLYDPYGILENAKLWEQKTDRWSLWAGVGGRSPSGGELLS